DRGYTFDVNLPDNQMYFFSRRETLQAVDALWPSEQDVELGLEILSRHHILPDYVIQNAREFLTKRTFKFNHCIQGYIEINIDSNGGVRTGCNVFEPVGNLLEKDLKVIINSDAYRESVKKMYRLQCDLCTCGYAISATYKQPWNALSYALKRNKGNTSPEPT